MENEQSENPIQEDHGINNIDGLEESKTCERNESIFGLTRCKTCESCKKIENCTPIGQSIRRCQACTRRKNSFERKPFHVELEREETLDINCDVKHEPITIVTTNFVTQMNTKLEDNLDDSKKDLSKEYFAVEHERSDLLGANVVKAPSVTNSEDGKVILKKKDNLVLSRKEYKPATVGDTILKKDKTGYLKGRPLLDKDAMVTNERKEPTIETLDSQKSKEEIELEKRERGWNVNGSIIGKSSSYSKVAPTKSLAMLDGCLFGKEQRDRVKVKSLKEKLDTQRILGLVAKRSESRINSPTHRNPNLSHNRNEEEVENPHVVNSKSNVVPSIIIHEKYPETSKLQESLNVIATNSEVASNSDETKMKPFLINVEGKSRSQLHMPQDDTESQFSSPTNLGCYSNENTLFGTQRILELLAKRNGGRVTSPTQNLEMNAHNNKPNNNTHCESKERRKAKNVDVTPQLSQLYDHQQENLIKLTCTTKSSYIEQDFTSMNNSGKILDLSDEISYALDHKKQQDFDHYNTSSTDANSQYNDTKFNNSHHVLEMVAQRNENGTITPKKCTYYNLKDVSLSDSKGNKFDYSEVTSDLIPSRTLQNKEAPSIELIPSTSMSCNHNIILKQHKGQGEATSHANLDTKTSKRNYEETIPRPSSQNLEFSTPSSTVCHVNDNPLYGTKFESEPISCASHSTNERCSYTSNQSPSPLIAQDSLDNPLKNMSKEALEICSKRSDSKETCSTLALNKPSICSSLDKSPLYKSAVATPTCKSPTKRINGKSTFQIEPKYHAKEVEIVEEGKIPTLENKRIEELNTNFFNKGNENLNLENGRAVEELHGINLIKKSGNILIKECCKEKSTGSCNAKAFSHKIMFKCQTFWWPIQIIFEILTFPFKLIQKIILFIFYLFKMLILGIIKMFKKFKLILILGVGNVRTKVLENLKSKCNNTRRYSRCGCASKTYILVVLSSLLLPSLFDLDFYLVNRLIEGQVIIRESLNFDYTKEHPTASVNLLPHQKMGEGKGYFLHKDVTAAHAFPPSYIFNIIVHLTLPESQYNQDVGMFQIVLETFSARGHPLNKASRASMLRYYSPPIKYMKSVILGVPIVLGLSQESQTLSIQMMESQEDSEHSPTARVNVEIEPKVGHVTGLGVPEIYDAELQVIAHNPYFRDVARNWVWNLYVYSGFALFVFEVLLVLYCCQRAFPQKEVGSKKKNDNKKTTFEKGQKFAAQAPIIKRLHKGQIYYSKSLPLALPNMSTLSDSRNTLDCSESTLEEFKMIRLTNEHLSQKTCKVS